MYCGSNEKKHSVQLSAREIFIFLKYLYLIVLYYWHMYVYGNGKGEICFNIIFTPYQILLTASYDWF